MALRKLSHPSRTKAIQDPELAVVLFATDETGYSDLYREIFQLNKRVSRLELLKKFIKQDEAKKQREKDIADFERKKHDNQAQITEQTSITECCFGDYFYGILENNLTVGSLITMCGDDVLALCDYKKSLFDELVTVLASKSLFLADYSPNITIETYLMQIYQRSKEKIIENFSSVLIEELGLSVRAFN